DRFLAASHHPSDGRPPRHRLWSLPRGDLVPKIGPVSRRRKAQYRCPAIGIGIGRGEARPSCRPRPARTQAPPLEGFRTPPPRRGIEPTAGNPPSGPAGPTPARCIGRNGPVPAHNFRKILLNLSPYMD